MLGTLAFVMAIQQTDVVQNLHKWFKNEALAQGVDPRVEGNAVTFAIKTNPGAKVRVVTTGFGRDLSLDETSEKGLFYARKEYVLPVGFHFQYVVDDKEVGNKRFFDAYSMPSEVNDPAGGLKGNLSSQGQLESKVFAGTTREWWIYLPPNLKPDTECALLVAQDGQWQRGWMSNTLDNMIAKGEIPPTVGVFIMPGGNKAGDIGDRSREYDTLSPDYVNFLLNEVLPNVEKKAKLTKNPALRAITGLSSGGICAFTACWERPDQFGVCISGIGSFTNIASGGSKREGGHNYPALIRKTDKKPIRVFLQDGSNDLDNVHGNWYLSNLQMEKALQFAGYDVKSSWGPGNHSDKHLKSIFPDTLRWWFNGAKK